jgi:DNA-binding transcriptional ArsR family regulator
LRCEKNLDNKEIFGIFYMPEIAYKHTGESVDKLAKIFKALGDETRLRLVNLLLQHESKKTRHLHLHFPVTRHSPCASPASRIFIRDY